LFLADPRFPERDNEWIEARCTEHRLLVEFLEDFKSKYGDKEEATDHLVNCHTAIEKFHNIVDKVKNKLAVQTQEMPRRVRHPALET
jgi:hypothetical protein